MINQMGANRSGKWLKEDFLLTNTTAVKLYQQFAAKMPIIDYHNHLPVNEIAGDINFNNLTQAWLYGDHYKWRAMRTNGVNEKYCTGAAGDIEKFQQYAATVPYTLRNPLYHWTHLELQRYFDIDTTLSQHNSLDIYNQCSAKLITPQYSVKNLLRKMNVQILCTTDDPTDNLEYHQKLKADGFEIKVLPTYRPDKAMAIENVEIFNQYLNKLEAVSDIVIDSFDDFLLALKRRHNYFKANGCKASDHGLESIYAEDYTQTEINGYFDRLRSGKPLNIEEGIQFKSAMLINFAEWNFEAGWVQQFHLGALRNNNTRMLQSIGADTGWDSIGDFKQAIPLAKFLNRLNNNGRLAHTIIYNLNPADNALFATMPGNFNEGSTKPKVQWGGAWWFLDQKDGMTQQINTLSNMGLLSKFVGMLTDSRSFLSFPRHEYFRRILCNLFGEEIENGQLPNDINWIGKIIEDICFNNTKEYFGW